MKTRWVSWFSVMCVFLAALVTQAHAVAAGPTVRVMPDGIKTTTKNTAYAWAGNSLQVWGNVAWGAAASGIYDWNFGDGSPDATGTISNARDIAVNHTYATAGTYYAMLTVTDGNLLSSSAQVRIDVLAVVDTQAQINRAIERGLKYLYLNQYADGHWYDSTRGSTSAATALSVLAFENAGHLPINPTSDIYQDTVLRGLNYAFTTINDRRTSFGNWTSPDKNGNGVILGISSEEFYPHGMMMMAVAAAGPYDRNYAKTDAIHNPALNLIVPGSLSYLGGRRYYDVLDDMMEYAAWAQSDPSNSRRGGWRYSPNNGDADNSVGQWPVIGLEAAELWGIVAPAWVKSELKDHWLVWSYSGGGWGYNDATYQTVSHSAAGLCMMAYVGISKNDVWTQTALAKLKANWVGNPTYTYEGYSWSPWPCHLNGGTYDNYYAMYGIAKACRIARDDAGNYSQITQIIDIDWYATYAAYIVPKQLSSGAWPVSVSYYSQAINTPFALLILEQNVSSLRPQASIAASPNPVPANTTVNFDISGSTHQDPAKYLVSWKLIYDTSSGKTWGSPDAAGTFPAPIIPLPGGYPEKVPPSDYAVTAIVQVTDNVGETAEAVVVVNVTTSFVPPVANPGGPYFGSVGVPLTLDGSGSYSPNLGGSITRYQWDLDGNGTYETDAGSSPTLSHTWSTPYTGQIGLRVTDNNGWQSTASVYSRMTVCDLKPVSYPLIAYRRINQRVWEYQYKFVIKNVGTGDATAVTAKLQNWPSQVTVQDDTVTFLTVPAGGTPVASTDTFTIRIDRTVPVQNSDLNWKLVFTTAGGITWTLVNFPLY